MVSRRQLLKLSALGTATFAAPLAYSASNTTMTHKNGSPLGSPSLKDVDDNARSLDLLVCGESPTYMDRRGVQRRSWAGMEGEFSAEQIARKKQFDVFLNSSGFEAPMPYEAGIELIRITQTVTYDRNDYRAKSEALPFTTSDWATDVSKLVLIGDDSLRQDIANYADPTKGAGLVGYTLDVAGAVNSTLYQKAIEEINVVNDFGADNSGESNTTEQMVAFYRCALERGGQYRIPAGDYLIDPGALDFSCDWVDKAFPHIHTDGHGAVRFIVASDLDKPMLRINNGVAVAAQYKLWRGGSHGGITFIDPFSESSASKRHGICIYGFCGTEFGYMRSIGLCGDLLHFERKIFEDVNPDPYNVAYCTFKGVEAIGSVGYGINNDNSVGVTHCNFKFIRVVDGHAGGLRGVGVASEYAHISLGNLKGWAVDIPFDLLVGGRTVLRFLELDNCENGYNIQSVSGLEIIESRIIHRFGYGANTLSVYWPVVSYNIGGGGYSVTSLNIKAYHRTQSGGSVAAIGKFVDFNNNTGLRGLRIALDISDNGALGILDTQLVEGLNRNSVDVVVTNRGKKVASTSSIIGCSLRGGCEQVIGTSGFGGERAKIIFTSMVYDTGVNYDKTTGYFKAPYDGVYRFRMRLTIALPIGTRVRLGLCRMKGSVYLAGGVGIARSNSAESYFIDEECVLVAGDLVYVNADQNSDSLVNLTGAIDAAVENSWSIHAMH